MKSDFKLCFRLTILFPFSLELGRKYYYKNIIETNCYFGGTKINFLINWEKILLEKKILKSRLNIF
jgi:hypothetical protein